MWDALDGGSAAGLPPAPDAVVQLMPVPQRPQLLVARCLGDCVAVWDWGGRQLLACSSFSTPPLGPMCAVPHPDALCVVMVAGDSGMQALKVPKQGPLVAIGGAVTPAVVQVACFGAGRCAAITAEGALLLWHVGQLDGCTLDVRVQGLAGCGEWLVAWGAEVGCLVLHDDR